MKFIVYYKDPKRGVGPLGLIRIFDTADDAYTFITRHFAPSEWDAIGVTNAPYSPLGQQSTPGRGWVAEEKYLGHRHTAQSLRG